MDNGIWLARIDSPKGLRQQSQYNKPMLSWHKTKQTQSKPPVAGLLPVTGSSSLPPGVGTSSLW